MACFGAQEVSHDLTAHFRMTSHIGIARYHPKDYTLSQAAAKLSEIRKSKQQNIASMASMLHKEFLRIRERLHPVLRHFFTESHKSPTAWFDMRLKYARSVATTSIVGHMMGIGDRHISNILLDQVSGEVVHIDFGIAFDQVRTQASG